MNLSFSKVKIIICIGIACAVLFWVIGLGRFGGGGQSDVTDRGARSVDSSREKPLLTSQRNLSNRVGSRTIESYPLDLPDWPLSDSDMEIVKLLDANLKASETSRVIKSGQHYLAKTISKHARTSLGIPPDHSGEVEQLIVQSIVRIPTPAEFDKLRNEISSSVNSLSSISTTEKELAEKFFEDRYLSDTFKFKLLESKHYLLVEGGDVKDNYSVSLGDYYDIMVTSDEEAREAFFLRGTPKFENTAINPMGREKERYGHIFESGVVEGE